MEKINQPKHSEINELPKTKRTEEEIRNLLVEVINELRKEMEGSTNELRKEMERLTNELREEMERLTNELRKEMKRLTNRIENLERYLMTYPVIPTPSTSGHHRERRARIETVYVRTGRGYNNREVKPAIRIVYEDE